MTHPLAMLSGDEISHASRIVRGSDRFTEGATFVHVILDEPHKDDLANVAADATVDRRVQVQLVTGPEIDVIEDAIGAKIQGRLEKIR